MKPLGELRVRTLFGDPEQIWHERCQTSGGYKIGIFHLGDEGVTRVGCVIGCVTCGEDF